MGEITIKKVQKLFKNQVNRRKIKVTLSNKTVIYIVSCYESWQQYGGTVDELRLTVPIAEKYNRWLHGND